MKKRGKIFLLGIFLTIIVISSLISLAKVQLEQFNKAYIQEEVEEIEGLSKQVVWAVRPILRENNKNELREYCDLFKNTDTTITIYDDNNLLIGTPHENFSKAEGTEVDALMVIHTVPLKIADKDYTLIVSTATKHMEKTLTKYQKYIVISVLLGVLIVVILGIYLLNTYWAFNRLQNSAIKISAGNLETDIFIPKGGLLHELACALDKMSKRLKLQINEMQKLEDFRSEFIANVSHEVKTPLTGILSAVEILEDENSHKNPTVEKCLNIMSKQAKRLNSLVQDILSLSEIERRQFAQKQDFQKISLSKIIKNCISMCDTDIKISTDMENIEMFCDSILMEQAILNLLNNAIKYSKTDKIDITAKRENGTIKISIRDYGVGIPKEHLPRLFEHFYRVDKARSRDLGGTGLGLAIVKNIVKLHNGEIYVKSDNGCEFIIEIKA